MNGNDDDDMRRETFEHHFSDCNLRRVSMGRSDIYESTQTSALWEGWQAAIRHMREQEGKA